MTKSLLEIAKENGAFIVKDEIGEDLVIPVSELQNVINAVNAQNGEPVAWMLDHIPNRGCRQISQTKEYADAEMARNDKPNFGKGMYPYDICVPLYTTPQTQPPELAEYIDRLENALAEIMHLTKHGYACMNVAKEALASKPKG